MLAVRLALAAVFLISGIAKAAAPRGTATAARDLGVPPALVRAVAVLLPAAEIAVATLLLLTPTVATGAAVAAALMAGFTALVAGNLIRGRRPACACFGALSAQQPIGATTLVRNAVLLAASVAVLIAALLPGTCSAGCYDAAGGRAAAIGAGLLVLVSIGVAGALIHSLSSTVGRLAARVRDLETALGRPPAARRPVVDVAALQGAVRTAAVTDHLGRSASLTAAIGGSPSTLLLLLSAQCGACERLRDSIRRTPLPAGLRVVGVIDRMGADRASGSGDALAVFVDGGRIAAAAGVQAFPSAVLLDAGLRPVGEVLTGTTEIQRFLDRGTVAGAAVPESPVTAEGVPQHA